MNLKDMKMESELLETVITDHLNYSRYFINIIGRNILRDHKNLKHIHKTLKDHFTSHDFNGSLPLKIAVTYISPRVEVVFCLHM